MSAYGLFTVKEMSKIACKYSEIVIVPQEAMQDPLETEEFTTLDGIRCKAKRICCWDNSDGRYDEEIEEICQRLWKVGYGMLRSTFIARLGKVGSQWHMIKLAKV